MDAMRPRPTYAHLLEYEPCPQCGMQLRACHRRAHRRMHELDERDRILPTHEEQARMIELYVHRGMTLHQIGELMHYHATSVRRALRANDVKLRAPRRGRGRQLSVDEELLTTQLYGQGYSAAQIGAILGLNQSSVLERLHRFGVRVRGRGGNVLLKRVEGAPSARDRAHLSVSERREAA